MDYDGRYIIFACSTALMLSGAGCSDSSSRTDAGTDTSTDSASDSVDVEIPIPTVAITSPIAGSILTSETVVVQGTALHDLTITSLRINGVEAASDDGFAIWSATITLPEGAEREISADLTDEDSNVFEDAAVITVSVDLSAPVVAITAPDEDETLTSGTVNVQGSVETPEVVSAVSVDGVAASSTSDNFATWEAELDLEDGEHEVSVDVTTEAGTYVDVAAVAFMVDISAPEAWIVIPGDGDTLTSTSVLVIGGADDLSETTSVTVNGIDATAMGGSLESWRATVVLAEGEDQTITVATQDEHGHADGAAAVVTVDVLTGLPEVVITSPAMGAELTSSVVHVEGTLSSPIGISQVLVNGIDAAPTASGSFDTWEADITVADGLHQPIRVDVVDETARLLTGLASIVVHVDATAPVVTITEPLDGALIMAYEVTVRGTATDLSGVASVTVNGTDAVETSPGFATWEVTVDLDGGANTLAAAATDALGNSADPATSISVSTPDHIPPWWDMTWGYRMELTVTTGSIGPLIWAPVFDRIDFGAMLAAAGVTADVDRNSIRVLDGSEAEVPSAVVAWYATNEGLLWFNPQTTLPQDTDTTFWLYFETTDDPKAAPTYSLTAPPDVMMAYQDNVVVRVVGDYMGGLTLIAGGIPTPGSGGHNCQAIADFDNDGDWDYAISRYGDSTVYFARNQSTGDGFSDFDPLVSVGNRTGDGATSHCMHMIAGDFNEDGWFDFVTENDGRSTDDMQIFIGNGDGTFQAPQTIVRENPTQGPRGLDVGDVDGDDTLDLVQGRFASSCNWYWFPGVGDGTFLAQQPAGSHLSCHNDDSYQMAAGDFNDDGWLDVIEGNAFYGYDNSAGNMYSGSSTGFTNEGIFPYYDVYDGSRSNVHGWLKAFDIDHDGFDDLVGNLYCDNLTACAGVYYWMRDPSAPFTFLGPTYIGNPGINWMGRGGASPSRDHNLHYAVTRGTLEEL